MARRTVPRTSSRHVSIRRCSVDELRSDAAHLFEAHWRTVTRGDMPLNIEWWQFYELERQGLLLALAARRNDEIVGYCLGVFIELPFSTQVGWHGSAIYVTPRERGIGKSLILRAEKEARKCGAVRMLWAGRERSTLGAVLAGLGYRVHEVSHTKELV